MGSLQWSEALALGLAEMDATHQEFVTLLDQVQRSGADELEARWAALIEHTQAHFGQEDQWMQSTGFSSANCHSTQHKVVLHVMREGLNQAQGERHAVIRQMASELADWFPAHAQTMDAALALHLRSVGYDPLTGQLSMPQALPTQSISSCGGNTCADRG
jgi:hemerythrin-like metal-binding protein